MTHARSTTPWGAAALLVLMAGCGERAAETPEADTQRAIDRSIADIRAAEAATRAPAEVSRSVGELSAAKADPADVAAEEGR
jgi:hypothetical protein